MEQQNMQTEEYNINNDNKNNNDNYNNHKYECKCGQSYNRNSSLFNHIKLKHENNKSFFLFSQQRVGRPIGKKGAIYKQKDFNKTPSIKIKCKCGSVLQGEGSFFNHINRKHNGDPRYKKERKQQGRKKNNQDLPSSKTTNYIYSDCAIQKEYQPKTNENQYKITTYNSFYNSEEMKQSTNQTQTESHENGYNSIFENENQQMNDQASNEQTSYQTQQDYSNNNELFEVNYSKYEQNFIEFRENMFFIQNIEEELENRDNRHEYDLFTYSMS